ncbi:MAG TPA: hypothetical protein VF041_06735 [Gemmatimonadaceae bacterium]
MRRRIRERAVAGATLALAACSAAPGGGAGAPSPLPSAREERVLVPAFTVAEGVAATERQVYVASPDGIAALDRAFDRWLPPVTRLDRYPGGQVTAIAADPTEDGVWVARPGALALWRPTLDQIAVTPMPGIVDAIVFDRRDPGAGAYVHGAGGWSLASRTGLVTPVSPAAVPPPDARDRPAGLADIWRQYPSLQAASSLITRDDALRIWPPIAGASTPGRSEVWLGTAGGGLFRADPVFLKGEQLPYGPLETGLGAVARAADGVWMAGLGQGERGGLAFATSDLQHWRWLSGALATRLAGARANRLAVRGRDAWLATDRGLVLLDTENPARVLAWTAGNGLPADAALAVLPTGAGAWAGTARGLVFVRDSGAARAASSGAVSATMASGVAVRALLLTGDTLWVGSDAGLLLVRGASPDSAPRRAAIADGRLSRPVRALARGDSLVVAATDGGVVCIDARTGAPSRECAALDASPVRDVEALAMDGRAIVLAGPAGVVVFTRPVGGRRGGSGTVRVLPVPSAVPDEAYDVALDDDFVWVATRAGLLRLARLSDGGVR